jgi:hypothetical protein
MPEDWAKIASGRQDGSLPWAVVSGARFIRRPSTTRKTMLARLSAARHELRASICPCCPDEIPAQTFQVQEAFLVGRNAALCLCKSPRQS